MTLPHLLPVTDPAAWCFICGEPFKDCPTPSDCGLVRPEPERGAMLPLLPED